MEKNNEFEFSTPVFAVPFVFVFLIWFVYWLEIQCNWNFNKHGIYPRSISGIKGIFASPFIHGDTSHLFNNSVPLFVLSASLFYFYNKVAIKVLVFGGFFTGLFTWIIARESFHIGASGIVYLLFSFVFFSGIIKKHYRLVAMSLITIFLYGSMIWYVLPIKEGVSWEGHLSGFVIGIVFAFLYKNKGVIKEKYEFTKTEFDDMFDDNGNYMPPVPVIEPVEEDNTNAIYSTNGIKVNYIYTSEEE